MKHLKLYEQFDFDENDPFGEEIKYTKSTFLSWLKNRYPDENIWSEIKEINCYNKQLTSLEGIENLINLERLYCEYNRLTSLKEIENLVNLKELDCSGNELTGLEGIENLVNLKEFDCHSNMLTTLEGIENLVNLKELWCYDNRLTIQYRNYLRDYCKKKRIKFNL